MSALRITVPVAKNKNRQRQSGHTKHYARRVMEIIEILDSLGMVLSTRQHRRHTLVPPMEQLEHRRGCHQTPLALGSDGAGYEASSLGYGIGRRIVGRRCHCPNATGR
jgi:hypothetical protein